MIKLFLFVVNMAELKIKQQIQYLLCVSQCSQDDERQTRILSACGLVKFPLIDFVIVSALSCILACSTEETLKALSSGFSSMISVQKPSEFFAKCG